MSKKYLPDILFLVLLLAPTTNVFYYIMTFVIVATIIHYKNETSKYWRQNIFAKFMFILLCILSLIGYIFTEGNVSVQAVIRIFVLTIMLFFFPFAGKGSIHITTVFIGVVYTLSTQLCYVFHISPIISFVNTFYPIDSDIYLYSEEYLSRAQGMALGDAIRLGGFMQNPNACARTYSFFYVTLLMFCSDWKLRVSNIMQWACVGFIVVGLILCGSRTGFAAFAAMSIIRIVLTSKNKAQKTFYTVSVIVAFILISMSSGGTNDSYRALSVSSGMNDSFLGKVSHVIEYYENDLPLFNILFGQFDQRLAFIYLNDADSMDSDIGISLFSLGIVTTIILVVLLYSFNKRLKKPYSLYMLMLLWTVSSSVIFAYRVSLVYMFLLSICYMNSLTQEKNGKYNN